LSEKYLLFITEFINLREVIHVSKDILKELNKNFKNFIIVNSENLKFLSQERNYDLNLFPDDYKYFNPTNISEFKRFAKDKEIIAINRFGRDYGTLGIHYTLKSSGIKQIMITKVGNIQMSDLRDWKHFILSIKSFFKRVFYKKFIFFLMIINFLPRIEIRFISNNLIIRNIRSSYFKNFIYKNKLFYAKELIPVNSRSYDFFFENKIETSEDYIVHLDGSLNYIEETDLRGRLSPNIIERHYFFLTRFLEKLSKVYKKEVIVCIHPSYNINEHKSFFKKKFNVFQFKTREYVCKSFIITNFRSSAVCDGIFLGKRALGLISNLMTKNEINQVKSLSNQIGYLSLNLEKDYHFNQNDLLISLNKHTLNYDEYIKNYHLVDKNITGNQKVVNIIKNKFNL
jgi:hypothetical protein